VPLGRGIEGTAKGLVAQLRVAGASRAAKLPADAHVGVRYRDTWFWIDDRDHHSKAAFKFQMLLFSLTETARRNPRRW
jgi:hypothetical protein